MKDWRDDRIGSATSGTDSMVMAELSGKFVAFWDTQFLPGYCVLLPKRKKSSLNDLKIQERVAFLRDMSLVGDVLLKVCSCQRVNYDILGNTAHFCMPIYFHVIDWKIQKKYSNQFGFMILLIGLTTDINMT